MAVVLAGCLITQLEMKLKNELAILDPKLSINMGVYIYRTEARLNISSERFWQFMRNQTT